ncbi:hypothetical protein CHS0354_042263 [Potamilus streckersoni]|uniref:Uncharacterized protein n=1 Tax=Potamilus streckersoni TaxID=2493646 RepID=A0AAE0STG7_9BIVA|nr:hypothetical protein CHS0354_042263 [Potamilus streckersoni]
MEKKTNNKTTTFCAKEIPVVHWYVKWENSGHLQVWYPGDMVVVRGTLQGFTPVCPRSLIGSAMSKTDTRDLLTSTAPTLHP